MDLCFYLVFLNEQQCSKLCGEGVQTRAIKCFSKVDGKIEVLSDSDCPEPKPETSQKCVIRPCEGVDWIVSQWSGVSIFNALVERV